MDIPAYQELFADEPSLSIKAASRKAAEPSPDFLAEVPASSELAEEKAEEAPTLTKGGTLRWAEPLASRTEKGL